MKTFIVSVSSDFITAILRTGWSTGASYGDTRLTVIKGIPKSARLIDVRFRGMSSTVDLEFECPDVNFPEGCVLYKGDQEDGRDYVYFNPTVKQDLLPNLLAAAKAALPVMKKALEHGWSEGLTDPPEETSEYIYLETAVRQAEDVEPKEDGSNDPHD